MEKKLGRIESITFGKTGYQEAELGLGITFAGNSWGVQWSKSFWDANHIKCTDSSQWTEKDRDKHYAKIMRFVSDCLKKAKVNCVAELNGIPVECKFNGNILKDWRILEEVL